MNLETKVAHRGKDLEKFVPFEQKAEKIWCLRPQ